MSDGVGSFDPAPAAPSLADVRQLIRLQVEHGTAAPEVLSEHEGQRLAPLVRAPAQQWEDVVAELDDAELEALIRFLTLAAEQLRGWEVAADAAVIPLFAHWRRRDLPTRDLVRWIREHSRNRFIPHGSLQMRL